MADESEDRTGGAGRRRLRWVGFLVGMAAVSAAVMAASGGVPLWERLSAIRASGWMWCVWLAAPLTSVALTAASFMVLTNARIRGAPSVGFGAMFAMIGGSWLLNFLPLSPGLFGRIAYQRACLGISVRDSMIVVGESIVLSWVAALMVVPIAYAADDPVLVLFALGVLASMWHVAMRRQWGRGSVAAARSAALVVKLADQCVWTLKYAAVFRMMGYEPTLAESCLVAAVAQSAMLVPFIGNGLGVREWMVALVASHLPEWFREGGGPMVAEGLTADLLGRAGEIAVAIPTGLCCLWLLSQRAGRGARSVGEKTGGTG